MENVLGSAVADAVKAAEKAGITSSSGIESVVSALVAAAPSTAQLSAAERRGVVTGLLLAIPRKA